MGKEKISVYELRKRLRGKGEKRKHKYNARKAEVQGGRMADSTAEAKMFRLFQYFEIEFEYQVRIELLPTLAYRSDEHKTKKRSITVDFYLPKYHCYVDPKGVLTDGSSLRLTLLKHKLAKEAQEKGLEPPPIFLVKPKALKKFCVLLKQNGFADLHAFRL